MKHILLIVLYGFLLTACQQSFIPSDLTATGQSENQSVTESNDNAPLNGSTPSDGGSAVTENDQDQDGIADRDDAYPMDSTRFEDNGFLYQRWSADGISDIEDAQLIQLLKTEPDFEEWIIGDFDAPKDLGNHYIVRMLAVFSVETSGLYQFFSSADDQAMVSFSALNDSPETIILQKEYSQVYDFTKSTDQASSIIDLERNKFYIVDFIGLEKGGADHFQLALSPVMNGSATDIRVVDLARIQFPTTAMVQGDFETAHGSSNNANSNDSQESSNGSSNENSGSGSNDDSDSSNNSGTSGNLNNPETASGKTLWDAGCANCHGADGNGKSPILGSLYRTDLVDYITHNMPYGSPANCDADCSAKVAQYMQANFDYPGADEIVDLPVIDIDSSVSTASKAEAIKVLHSASLNLLKRLPTDAELAAVEKQGSAALSGILDAQLEEPALLEQLDVIFNRALGINVTRNKDGYHSFLRNYSWNSFDNGDSEWPKDYKNQQGLKYTTLRQWTSNGHALAPVELIKYVVENDLPFTEILTANYTMLNWYAAKSFGLENDYQFRDIPNGGDLGAGIFTKDPEHFVPVYLPKVPSAGVLTTGAYMLAHRTTDNNRNRNRAYKLFKHFLDTDLFEIGGERPGDGDSIHTNPEINDPRCTSCHDIMDPVASSYKNWLSKAGQGRPYFDPTPSSSEWNTNGILPAGFNGEFVPEGVDSMPWLAKKVTADPRFAKAMVKIVFTDFTGQALIPSSIDGKTFNSLAFREQQAFLEAVATQFIADNFNMKKMVKNLLLSDYIVKANSNPLAKVMLNTEQVKTKISQTLKQSWGDMNSFGSMYQASQSPSGVTATVQLRMAEDMACELTAAEFSKIPDNRILFTNIEPNIVSGSAQHDALIKQTIVETYQRLTGYRFEANDKTIELAFKVYERALELGQAGIGDGSISTRMADECRVNKNQAAVNKDYVDYDSEFYTRAWQAVLQYVLMDPRYFYY